MKIIGERFHCGLCGKSSDHGVTGTEPAHRHDLEDEVVICTVCVADAVVLLASEASERMNNGLQHLLRMFGAKE